MKNIKKVGASKVSRLTFLLVFIFLVIILLTRSCFNDYKAIETNEEVSTLIRQKKISNNGKIDVNQERYYYDLGLLDEKILPEIYQQNDIEDIYLAENQVNVFESNYFNQNIDINVFDDISLNVDFNKIQQNIQKANLISQKSDEQSSITKEEEFKDLTVEEKSIENGDLIEDDFSDEDLFADEEFDEEFDEDLFADEEFDDDFFGDEEFDDNFFDGGFANDLGTPFEPILFPPFIQTQEEYDLFNPSETEENQTDDDFFSDFYIAGESDQALFDDGIYYLTLFVNGDRVGDVETKFEGSTYSIGSNSLYENVSGLLSDYCIQRLFNN